MDNKVNVKFVGGVEDSIFFQCPSVSPREVKKGDIIEGVPRETYEKELKNNFKYQLVSEKPQAKGKILNKLEKESEAE